MSAEFFQAIKDGDTARVRQLVESDLTLLAARDDKGLGAYTVARYSGKDDIARLLLEKGAELDIFAAAMAGAEERVIELLAANRQLLETYSHDGWTALHLAAFFGFANIAEILLANGADVRARSRNQMRNTPLHAAVAGRAPLETAAVLLAHGAEVNARQDGGWTPLHQAAQNGNVELIEMLLAQGADTSARADNNQTALDLAMTKGHQAASDLLYERATR